MRANFDELACIDIDVLHVTGLPETYRKGTPVLFLRGAKDGTSSKAVMRETRRLYPAAKIITYEDAAHWIMIEKKEAVTRDVLDWLCEVGL